MRTVVPSAEVYVTCCARTAGTSTVPGALAHSVDGAGPRVVVLDRRRRHVVGVAEPRLVAALGTLDDAADRARARAAATSPVRLAGRQVVHGDLGDRVPGPGRQQHRVRRARRRRGPRSRRAPPPGPAGPGRASARPSGAAGSVTQTRPRGASRSVKTYRRPSRPTSTPVCASTSTWTGTQRRRVAAGDADRSAIHRSLRGAVPSAADTTSQRPSRDTDDAEVLGRLAALAEDEHVGRRGRRRAGAARPGGGTAPRRPGPGPAASRRT